MKRRDGDDEAPGDHQTGTALEVPSAKTLAIASALAVSGAIVILLTAVLPAEYGIDPLGIGRRLGFFAMSQAAAPEPVAPPTGAALAPVQEGNVGLYPGPYKVDSRTFVLGPYEYLEFKYHLAKDATMLFSWEADGNIQQDLHGDRDGVKGDEATTSYDKTPRRKADGSFTAPFSGIHGWFWENPAGESVTVKLTTAGFYTTAHEFHSDRTRYVREVQSLTAIPATDKQFKEGAQR
jgi:hypothetical protein